MAKADVLAAAILAVQAGELQVLSDQMGSVWDQCAVAQKASDGTLTQADLDAAVLAAQAVDAQAMADAKDVSDKAIAVLSAQLAELGLKEGQEAGVIAGLQSSVAAVQASLAAIVALLPVPAPSA